jgi:predicted nucleotidyltransferase
MKIVYVEPQHFDTLKRIIAKHFSPQDVGIFGSRAIGSNRPNSDLDLLLLDDDVTNLEVGLCRLDLEESDIPFPVDIVRMQDLNTAYSKRVLSELIPLDQATPSQPS